MFACKFLNWSALVSLYSRCIHRVFYPIVYGEQCCLPAPASFPLQGGKPVQQLSGTMLGTGTGGKKTQPTSFLYVHGPQPHSRMKMPMQNGAQAGKFLYEAHIWGPRAGRKGLGEVGVDRWPFSINRLNTSDLLIDPKVPLKKPTLLLAGSHHDKKAHETHFLQGPMHLLNCTLCFYVPSRRQQQPCKDFRLKPPSILVHRSIFEQRKKTILKSTLGLSILKVR